MPDRYYTTETHGFRINGPATRFSNTRAHPNMTVLVLDRLHCHHVAGRFATEELTGNIETRFATARHEAQALADQLNQYAQETAE